MRVSGPSCATARSALRRWSGFRSRCHSTTVSEQGILNHSRAARAAGLGIDEITLARQFDSDDPREAALAALPPRAACRGSPRVYLHEEAR